MIRPNVFPAKDKAEWIDSLEASFAEMMGNDLPYRDENYDAENDTEELLIPYPRDEVYVTYLCAKIDYVQEETALYQNDMMAANQAIAEVESWWRRNNRPLKKSVYRGVYR